MERQTTGSFLPEGSVSRDFAAVLETETHNGFRRHSLGTRMKEYLGGKLLAGFEPIMKAQNETEEKSGTDRAVGRVVPLVQ